MLDFNELLKSINDEIMKKLTQGLSTSQNSINVLSSDNILKALEEAEDMLLPDNIILMNSNTKRVLIESKYLDPHIIREMVVIQDYLEDNKCLILPNPKKKKNFKKFGVN